MSSRAAAWLNTARSYTYKPELNSVRENSQSMAKKNNETRTGSATGTRVYSSNIHLGGIAGTNNGVIYGSMNFGLVSYSSTPSAFAGGITGMNYGYTYGFNSGDVHNNFYTGGIAGQSYGGAISGSYNDGTIHFYFRESYTYAGGIVGYQFYGFVEGCSNSGTIIYSSPVSYSTSLQPIAGQIAGHFDDCPLPVYYGCSGFVDKGTLITVGSHNQALYVSNGISGEL